MQMDDQCFSTEIPDQTTEGHGDPSIEGEGKSKGCADSKFRKPSENVARYEPKPYVNIPCLHGF